MIELVRSWAAPAVGALLLSAVALAGVLTYRSVQHASSGGSSLMDVQLARLGAGGNLRLADLRGKPVVVNFFASWCPACITELPTFDKASRLYRGRLTFVGVDEQDDPSAGLRLARESGVGYELVRDTDDGRLFRLVHGTGMPTTVFLGPDGGIRDRYSGELSADLLEQRLQQLAPR